MDARHRDVLVAVIRDYIDSTEPVGSRVLARRHFPNLSAATLRNVMADLEEMGYLVQPHTSAGRVPTDKAYRFYVESFPLAPPLKQTTLARVDLIPLEDDRALAVLVTDAGWVTARAVTLDPPFAAEEVRA